MGRRYSLDSRELSANDFPVMQNMASIPVSSGSYNNFFSASASGHVVNDRTAMQVAAVYACVERIAVISTLPKHIYTSKNGINQRIEHDYWNILNSEPTPAWTAASFWERKIAEMLLHGDGIAQIIRKNKYSTQIVGIKPFINPTVYITKKDDRLIYKISDVTGTTESLDQDDVLHFPGFGFNGLRGMSVIQHAAKNGIGIALAADHYSSEFFANGQRPDFLLTTQGSLSKEQKTSIKESIEERHQGVGNRFKPLILQGGLTMEPITMTAEDSQLLETRKFEVVDICMAFGVPPQLVGAQDSVAGWAGSSLEQLNIGFAKYTLRSHIARITQEINRKLFKNTPYFCEFNLDAFLEGDSKSQAEYFSRAIGGPGAQGWMSVNEVRAIKNLPPDPTAEYNNVIISGNTAIPKPS